MSFMKGFGDAFSKTFNAELERKEQRKRDAFQVMYDNIKENQSIKKKAEAQDRADIAKAKALTASAGVDLPEDAWMNTYQWVKGGLGEDQILENLRTGSFEAPKASEAGPSSQPAGAATASPPQEAPAPSLEAQTNQALTLPNQAPIPQQKGSVQLPQTSQEPLEAEGVVQPEQTTEVVQGQEPQAPQPTQPTQAGPVKPVAPMPQAKPEGSIFNPTGKGIFTNEATIQADARKRISEATGLSEDQLQQIEQFVPGDEQQDTSRAPKFTSTAPAVKVPDLPQAIYNFQTARTPEQQELAKQAIDAQRAAISIRANADAIAKAQAEGITVSGQMVQYKDPNTGKLVFGQLGYDENQQLVDVNHDNQPVGASYKLIKDNSPQAQALDRITAKGGQKEAADYRSSTIALQDMLRTADNLNTLVTKYPNLQQGFAANLAGKARDVVANTMATLGLAASAGKSPEMKQVLDYIDAGGQLSPDQVKALQVQESTLEDYVGKNVNDLAAANALYQTQVALFSYQYGAALGQEGRALLEQERQKLAEAATTGQTPQEFRKNMSAIVSTTAQHIANTGRNLNQYNNEVNDYEQRFGPLPDGFGQVPAFEDMMNSSDDQTKRAYQLFNHNELAKDVPEAPKEDKETPETPTTPAANKPKNDYTPQGYKYGGKTATGKDIWISPKGEKLVDD